MSQITSRSRSMVIHFEWVRLLQDQEIKIISKNVVTVYYSVTFK